MNQSIAAAAVPNRLVESPATFISAARIACAVLTLADIVAIGAVILAPNTCSSHAACFVYLFIFTILGASFGVLGLYSRGHSRVRVFATVLITDAILQIIVLIPFLLESGANQPGRLLLAIRLGLLALSLMSLIVFGLLASPVITHGLLLQSAHRAIALGIWVLVGRAILEVWNRPLPLTEYLIPIAYILFVIAVAAAQIVYWTARENFSAEARGVFFASAAFAIATLLFLPDLAPSFFRGTIQVLKLLHFI